MKYTAPQAWRQSNKDSQEIGDGNVKTYSVSILPLGSLQQLSTRWKSGHKLNYVKKSKVSN